MATRKRSDWHRTKNGCWTCSLGERGMRVWLFQKRRDGPFYRAMWRSGQTEDQKPLATKDQDEALRLGKSLLSELLKGEFFQPQRQPLTLSQLWERYSHECADFLDNAEKSRKDATSRARILLGYFGEDFRVEDFTVDDQRRYERARQDGGIITSTGDKTVTTRARSA